MNLNGLGRGVQAFYQGQDDADEKRYRDETRGLAREDRDRRIKNEAEDRGIAKEDRSRSHEQQDFTFDRQKINAGRADEQYKIDQEQKSFARVLDMAMGNFHNSGDPSPLQELYNKRYPDGGDIQIGRNDDGTYNIIHTDESGKPTKQAGLSQDQISMMAFGMRDPGKYLEHRNNVAAAGAKQKGELDKLTHEYGLKAGLERVKADPAGTGKGVAGSKADKEGRLRVQQGLGVLQSHYGGKFEGGVWFPDDSNKDEGFAAQTIMETLVRGQNTDPVKAGYQASAVSSKLFTAARKKAEERAAASGNDKPEQIEAETKMIANILVNKYLEKSSGTAQPGTEPDRNAAPAKPSTAPQSDEFPADGSGLKRPEKSGSGGSKPNPKSTNNLKSDVEKYRFKIPESASGSHGTGGEKGLAKDRSAKAMSATVKKLSAEAKRLKGYSNLGNMDRGDMKVALNDPDMSDDLKRAIITILKRKE